MGGQWGRSRCQGGDALLLSVLRVQSCADMGVGSQRLWGPRMGAGGAQDPWRRRDRTWWTWGEACCCLGEWSSGRRTRRGQLGHVSPTASGGHCRNSGLALGPAGEVGGSAAGRVTHGEGPSCRCSVSSLCSWQDPLSQRVEGPRFPSAGSAVSQSQADWPARRPAPWRGAHS